MQPRDMKIRRYGSHSYPISYEVLMEPEESVGEDRWSQIAVRPTGLLTRVWMGSMSKYLQC